MSCYGWERGSVKLPSKEWTSFKKELISRVQNRKNHLLHKAESLYSLIKAEKVKDKEQFIESKLRNPSRMNWDEIDLIKSSLLKVIKKEDKITKKLQKPKKSLFKVKSTETRFLDQEISVSLNNKTKEIFYSSDDNNHSIDVARNTSLGKTVISLLKSVSYSNKTGGYFQAQTEYDADEGRGASVTETFGKYSKLKYYPRRLGNYDL